MRDISEFFGEILKTGFRTRGRGGNAGEEPRNSASRGSLIRIEKKHTRDQQLGAGGAPRPPRPRVIIPS